MKYEQIADQITFNPVHISKLKLYFSRIRNRKLLKIRHKFDLNRLYPDSFVSLYPAEMRAHALTNRNV